ncbi:MAG: hypothetical protein CMH08_09535 [Marinovum sp.]|nr:hypothetical protein [Marinovum sp.]
MGRGNTLSRSVGHPVQGRDGALQVPWGCDGRLDAKIARASFSNSAPSRAMRRVGTDLYNSNNLCRRLG